jgi:esterase/lipase
MPSKRNQVVHVDRTSAEAGPSSCADGRSNVEAIFVHGFATSRLDLSPLAAAFADRGIFCNLLTLDGHGDSGVKLEDAKIDTWLDQVRTAVDASLQRNAKTYIVGFSFGAALALQVARERKIDGVLCLAAFAHHSKRRLARMALLFSQFPPVGPRRPRVTSKSTLAELEWTPKIPTSTLREVLETAPKLSIVPRNRKVLFIHSIDDPVSAYAPIAERVRHAASDDVKIITLSGLAHFIQFDISPDAICEAALEHFAPSSSEVSTDQPLQVENLKNREEEIRHWSNVLSLLFLGFFTTFGAILRIALPDIINKTAEAPYYLLGYPVVLAVYLEFVFLYLFYLDRVQAYVRIYLDPLLETGIGWVAYRTTRWVSGQMSRQMTHFTAASAIILPTAAAISSLGLAIYDYHLRIFSFSRNNFPLFLLALLSVGWLAQAVYAGAKLARYSKVYLYMIPPIVPASRGFLIALQAVYMSTLPGGDWRISKRTRFKDAHGKVAGFDGDIKSDDGAVLPAVPNLGPDDRTEPRGQ